MTKCARILATIVFLLSVRSSHAAFQETKPRDLQPGEIAVQAPGMCAEQGKTYVLTADISSPATALFLGNNVTLDLNGHTVTFADGKYEHIPNYGFEDGLKHWDISKASGAKIVSTNVRPLVGKQFCLLPQGQEVVSEYITLPVADRSYYAICSVSQKDRSVTLVVEDEKGNPVRCEFRGGEQPRVGGTAEGIHPELGGGTVFTHLHYLPAGKYRLRVKAVNGDCEIDECDIRPAMDVGVAIVGQIAPWATYADVMKWYPCAFFDYAKKNTSQPAEGIPVVSGKGKIVIKNGAIKVGFAQGARSWGIQSTAKDVDLLVENVKILNSGLNCGTIAASCATIRNCRLEVDTPFIINRHDTSEMNVKLGKAVEIAGNEIIGGQGCLSTGSGNADVHDNLFANGQTVTNHYSISPGTGDRIYNNRFEPLVGSGIYIGRSQNVEVFNNVFKISSAPPNCEYRNSTYSTNAIRISDYNEPMTSPEQKRCFNNKIYKNKIFITGKAYPEFAGYEPATYAFFISVGGGKNQIYENEIQVTSDGKGVRALAFYIGGSGQGGEIFNNKIVSNVTPNWFGTDYGSASNVDFHNNTIVRARDAANFKPFRLGDGGNTATKIQFKENKFENCEFGVEGKGEYSSE